MQNPNIISIRTLPKILSDEEISIIFNSITRKNVVYDVILNSSKKRIGYCDLRFSHDLSFYYYGNIGYRIDQPFRGHNFAYKATLLLLSVAKEINMDYCLLTCSPENIASEKTIKKLGAEYIETCNVPIWHPLYADEKIKKIYRLNINQ